MSKIIQLCFLVLLKLKKHTLQRRGTYHAVYCKYRLQQVHK